jgi:S-(hydroxymethyl)glutathione dehydrogenase/alcohol dehydrogenase
MPLSVRSTRAAILVEQHKPLVVDEIELPERLEPGQVLVRIRYSGICGSQLGEIDGVKGPDPFLPHLLGHEAGAVVVEVGERVEHVRPGDHVVVHWRRGAGMESATPRYRWRGRGVNAGWATTFNAHAVVSENRLTPVPEDFELDLAALLGCPITTALGVVSNDARLTAGESILVVGSGGIGLGVIQAAALLGANPIIAFDRHDNRLELARRLGATHVIHAGRDDLAARLRAAAGDHGADVVIENTGNVELIGLAYELTKPQGRTVLVGVPPAGQKAEIATLPLHFGKVLTGSHGGGSLPQKDIPHCVRLYTAGKLRLAEMITARFQLRDVNLAIAELRSGKVAGRCLIDMEKP